jgi:hypothetical protein
MDQQPRHYIVPAYLGLCLLLGGASAAGFGANLLLQLLAIPMIGAGLLAVRRSPLARSGHQLLLIMLLAVLLIAVQLVPLPPALWTALPGRGPVAEGFEALGYALPWLPLSLTPHATIASALWLLPAAAVLLGILRLGAYQPRALAWTVIAITAASVLVGALQLTGGDASLWYFYEITNYGQTTGFFSNANHLATLLLATLPLLAALWASYRSGRRSGKQASAFLLMVGGFTMVVLVGLAINGSLAGLGLAAPVTTASLMLAFGGGRSRLVRRLGPVALLLCVAGGAVLAFSSPMGNNLTTVEAREDESSRFVSINRTIEASRDYLPVGSGIGSFVPIYRQYEERDAVTRFFMNHVHSDYVELLLETGLAGMLLILLFLLWWIRQTVRIWSDGEADLFARAATVATAAILLHSLVDYPLRTAAISALFACCIALMAEPRPRATAAERRIRAEEADPRPRGAGARHLSAD